MFTRIAALNSYPDACLVASMLAEAGFHPAPIALSVDAQIFAGVDRTFRVEVPADESEAATEFLDQNGYGKHVVRR